MKVEWGKWVDDNVDAEYGIDEENAIIDNIVKTKRKFGGMYHQGAVDGCPYVNGKPIMYSFREWGRIMATAWNIIENTSEYKYTDFAWGVK